MVEVSQLKGKEAQIRTAGSLAVVGAVVAVPPPGTAWGAAVVHLQTAKATDSGPRGHVRLEHRSVASPSPTP